MRASLTQESVKLAQMFLMHSQVILTKHDPAHVKLREMGWAMAQRVFHPQEAERWPTKDANTFMNKHLTLVLEQMKELESDLV